MCVVCGCGHDGEHTVVPAGTVLHYGQGPAGASLPGQPALRVVQIEADVLGANQRLADRNRAHFAAHGVAAFNLLSSPGSGKTTLLCATIAALRARAPQWPVAVIEGDQQTQLDAERIRAAGAPAVQVNTGRGCHLDAQMVGEAFERLDLHGHGHGHGHGPVDAGGPARALLFIENVGNLVCPALWDLGEAAKVVILSVTEGEDKPLKYPDMFAAATLLVLNKTDLLPHLDFDVSRCIEAARRLNPAVEVIQLSARTGQGMAAWLQWLERRMAPLPLQARHAHA
jgi:hydrogenase nickel incorporation protein HypB